MTTQYARTASRVGLWASIGTGVWTLWFMGAFGPYQMAQPAWLGIEAFAASFNAAAHLAWVIPCLLLTLTFPILMAAIHMTTPEERRIWSWLGLIFGLIYGAVLGATYWLEMTVVCGGLVAGNTEGLTRLVVHSPGSIANSLEGFGYCLMGLATLFAGFAFTGGRLERWIRGLLVVNGAAGAGCVIVGLLGAMWFTFVGLAVWFVTLVAAVALLAVRYGRPRTALA